MHQSQSVRAAADLQKALINEKGVGDHFDRYGGNVQALGRHQRSLAKLLDKYCHVTTDKSFQKSDWRVRFALQTCWSAPCCAMPRLPEIDLQSVPAACQHGLQ